nr:hypothetical protein [Breoghania sp.]
MLNRFKLLAHLSSSWEGEDVAGNGLVHMLNSSGSRPALLWCFNAAHEFPLMAGGLGGDQPLIGLRSLHLVTPNGPNRYSQDEKTADLYADLLLSSGLELDGCAIGGNCQGAGVATPLAARLLQAGIDVKTLVIMEARLPSPFPGHVGFVYGDRSEMFNPFLRGEQPEARWDMLCQRWNLEIIPGSHGEFFGPENGQTTCDAIDRLLDMGHRKDAPAYEARGQSLEPIDLPQRVTAGERLELGLRSTTQMRADPEDAPLVLLYFWVSDVHGLVEVDEPPHLTEIDAAGSPDRVLLKVPELSGDWDLRVFLCRAKGGPVQWQVHDQKRYRLRVE